MRPTDVPDTGELPALEGLPAHMEGLLCDLLWSDPDKDITGWSENDRGVSFTFGPDVVSRFLQKHDMDLICRAHQVSQQREASIDPELICRWWRTVMNSSQSDSSSLFSPHQTIVGR